jgi:hypothetical protein
VSKDESISGYFSKPKGGPRTKLLKSRTYFIGFVQTFCFIYGLHRRVQ